METQTLNPGIEVSHRNWVTFALRALAILLVGGLLLFRLDAYPRFHFDEGAYLQVAKNYAVNNIYADYGSEEFYSYGPLAAVGPTVILPIALIFKLTGVNIFLARFAIVLYGVFTIIATYGLGTALGARRMAIGAAVFLLLSPGLATITYSRTVMGEIPGLGFCIAGLWLWLKDGSPGVGRLIGVGVLMGLASITKTQYALVILPALLLSWIVDLFWYRQHRWFYYVIPGVIAGILYFGWLAVLLLFLGNGVSFQENLATLRTTGGIAFFVWKIREALHFLISGEVYAGLFIPALIYGTVLGLPRTKEGHRWGTLGIFTWLGTFLYVSSLAWARYAFLPVGLGALYVGQLLHNTSDGFRFGTMRPLLKPDGQPLAFTNRMLVAGVFVILALLPLFWWGKDIISERNNADTMHLVEYLNAEVPQDAVIETYEQEMAVLTDHAYHYPPHEFIVNRTAEWVLGDTVAESSDGSSYDFRDYATPDYVLVGAPGQWTGFYTEDRLRDYIVIEQFGDYTLYQRRQS